MFYTALFISHGASISRKHIKREPILKKCLDITFIFMLLNKKDINKYLCFLHADISDQWLKSINQENYIGNM